MFRHHFQIGDAVGNAHSVAVKTDFLSFGYQPFFGAFDSVRFDFGNGGWQTQALVNGKNLKAGALNNGMLWQALPHNPSACFAVPVDWPQTEPVLQALSSHAKAPLTPLAAQFAGPAAVCWYGNSRLHTPVFIAAKKDKTDMGALFEELFALSTGKPPAAKGKAEPVVARRGKQGEHIWQRKIASRAGNHGTGENAYLLPTLAVQGQTVVFSPDDALVEQVLAVARKQAPAASDTLPDAAHTIALISPSALSTLAEKEVFSALPKAEEPLLRTAANAHLLPRLAALKKHPPYRLVLKGTPPANEARWMAVEWQPAGR